MNNNYLVLVVVLLLTLAACNTINELRFQARSGFASDTVTTVPFRYVKQLIVVDAQINNSKETGSFIFDTGAFQSKVEYHLSEELGLSTVTKRNNGTAQGIKREIEITSLDSMKMSSACFLNIAAGRLKYDAKSYSPCVAEAGIIGANLIKLAHWKIDYEQKTMKVSKVPFVVADKEQLQQIPFSTSFLSGVPKVDIEIEGRLIENVIFDLGYNGGLVVPFEYAKHFPSKSTQTLIDQSTAGIFGSNRDTLIVKDLNVKLGAYEAKIPVEFSSLNKALIGNDFLEHFTIYLNYEDNTVLLRPNSSITIDKSKTFIPGILNDSLWIVNRTNPKISLKIGDTLRSVNGRQPKTMFTSHCDYFLNSAKIWDAEVLTVETLAGNEIQISLNPSDAKD
ncbi:hypothetical protein ACFQZJ_14660 [Maribacter chungangensis]|uniref:Aspartyl protease n=1 Tax=Maribacter chungangensis TaxID=1069117 RepID=A0ABW3B749_9FLAO